jgi:tellurite methyltransferase
MTNLKSLFGDIDIYLFDQLLKGRLVPPMRVLDAGCGRGRNMIYLLQNGFEVFGIDTGEDEIKYTQSVARRLAPELPPENFIVGEISDMPIAEEAFDAVLCSAVLHFSENEEHFHQMVDEMWRVLKPGGLFFARLASTIGMEELVEPMEGRWFSLPDRSNRFLVDEAMLVAKTVALGGTLLDPIKTTNVQNLRAMTTWVLQK